MLRIYWNILEIRPAIGAAVPLFILDSEGQIFLSSSSSPEEEEKKQSGVKGISGGFIMVHPREDLERV